MAGYLTKHYKGTYRILPVINKATNDFCRDCNNKIDEDNVYIKCQYDMEIYHYGKSKLAAYIPSLQRGHNMIKNLKKDGVEIFNCDESDQEVIFQFNASDIDKVAKMMKASISGAGISPWSERNLPKNKVDIPEDDMARYKEIISVIDKPLVIKDINKKFLDEVLAKKLRPKGKRKPFDYASDMKQMCLKRDTKGYIYTKGLWNEYLSYLDSAIDDYYNDKQ